MVRLADPVLCITDTFESGNIQVLDAGDPSNIQLAIKPDVFCQTDGRAHYQWFYFAVTGAAGTPLTLHITNAGGASYPDAWPATQAVHSYDLVTWSRTPTTYNPDSGILTIRLTPSHHHVRLAYFAPYTNQQVDELVAGLRGSPGVQLHPLPPSNEGRPMYLLHIAAAGPPAAATAAAAGPPTGTPAAVAAAGGDAGGGMEGGMQGGAGAVTFNHDNDQQQQQQQQGLTQQANPLHSAQVQEGTPLRLWFLARQHPGEPQGSWFVEELLTLLATAAAAQSQQLDVPAAAAPLASKACNTSAAAGGLAAAAAAAGGGGAGSALSTAAAATAAAAEVLRQAEVFVVPCMCPDGVARGHLRTNALGTNLNREWARANPEHSPEVAGVMAAMSHTGCDFLLDVHGDEEVPGVFISGLEGLPEWGPRLEALQDAFVGALLSHSTTFQTSLGYPRPAPGSANLAVCAKSVAAGHACLALTLEMPFKDAACAPEPVHGWSPDRCRQLARDVLCALPELLPVIQQHRATR